MIYYYLCHENFLYVFILLGVQDVMIDIANHKVVIQGKKIDPLKVLERLRKKYSRNVELISPKFFELENEEKKDEGKKEDKVSVTKSQALNFLFSCDVFFC